MQQSNQAYLPKGRQPGFGYRLLRRICQALLIVAIFVGPFLGGWQRLDHSNLSAWNSYGWDLPAAIGERLPIGDAAARAYAYNQLLGGGTATSIFRVPVIDPILASVALVAAKPNAIAVFAWLLPLVVALLAGRFFCGWLCPFGMLSRLVMRLHRRLPSWFPRYRVPRLRPMRWIILAAIFVFGFSTSWALLYLCLPHLLIQQSLYGFWLLGGGGTALGLVIGLFLAGVVFGPTLYCATVCPTGAALSLFGFWRPFRIWIDQQPKCGAHCDLCDRACWLALKPSSGDPGPDCDACTRCFQACPKGNLRAGFLLKSPAGTIAAPLLLLGFLVGGPARGAPGQPYKPDYKPLFVFEHTLEQDGVTVNLGIQDLTGIRLDPDAEETLSGIEISLALTRGARGPRDVHGRMGLKEQHVGPVSIEIRDANGMLRDSYVREKPNAPRSVGHQTIYRDRRPLRLIPGDRLILQAVPGWTSQPLVWTMPMPTQASDSNSLWAFVFIGFLLFSALLSLSLIEPPPPSEVWILRLARVMRR